jgi:dephospho-CoA kinase
MKLKSKFDRLAKEQRLYQLEVPVIGLTGGIASGKSTVGLILQEKGFPLINADHLVKEIYALPETLDFISKEIPDAIKEGSIQFPTLRQKVFLNPDIKLKVENFIYARLENVFKAAGHRLNDPKLIVYDVPLLFEKKMETLFDLTVLVYAPRSLQRARLMKRDGLSEEMANNILNQQMDIEEKKLKAEFIIDNSQSEAYLSEEIKKFLQQITE